MTMTNRNPLSKILRMLSDFYFLLFVPLKYRREMQENEIISFCPNKKRLRFLGFKIYILFYPREMAIFFVSSLEKFVFSLLHYKEQSPLELEYCLMTFKLLFLHSRRETAS